MYVAYEKLLRISAYKLQGFASALLPVRHLRRAHMQVCQVGYDLYIMPKH